MRLRENENYFKRGLYVEKKVILDETAYLQKRGKYENNYNNTRKIKGIKGRNHNSKTEI